jgi:hypothetical protein
MITDSNQACMAKMIGRRVQEEVLFFPNPAGQKSHVKAFTYKSCSGMILEFNDYGWKPGTPIE